MADEPRAVMLSAAQPTNAMTLGNVIGAIRRWPEHQDEYDCFFFAVDQHAITLRLDPTELRENTYRAIATYLAAGLDPQRSTVFIQSHVPEHTELAWVLSCHAYLGELSRMTQYKDKTQGNAGDSIGFGLLAYPTLMASDILLYRGRWVPVGADQKQHLELTRDLARRMNGHYQRELFVVPDVLLGRVGARVMSLQEPTRKMSKSDPNPKATVFITDSDKSIAKKIKSAVTDSGSVVELSEEKPGVANLLGIQAALTGRTPEAVAADYEGRQYGHLKVDTAEVVVQTLGPLRDEVQRLMSDRSELDAILAMGRDKARERAQRTLSAVYEALGFVPAR